MFNKDIAEYMLSQAKEELNNKLSKLTCEDNPYLIVLGGQPGSGKSSIINLLRERFSGKIIALNGDDFKIYYPNYDDLLKKDWDATAQEVQPYSNYVVDQLKKEFFGKNLNLIIEGTMRSSKAPLETIALVKGTNYTNEAYVVATHYYASRVGCLFRMETDCLEAGSGRGVAVEKHDEAYKNIPNTIDELVESKQLSNFTVMTRDGTILGSIDNGDDVVKTYTEARNQLSLKTYEYLNHSLNSVLQMMKKRAAPAAEVEAAIALQDELHKYYEEQ